MNNSRKALKESLENEMEDLEFDSNYDDDDFAQVLSDAETDEMVITEEAVVQKPSVCSTFKHRNSNFEALDLLRH